MWNPEDQAGFTLVEVLVVIAITAVMIAWILPALQKARDQANLVGCLSNQAQIGKMISVYAEDHDGNGPVPPLGIYFDQRGWDIGYRYMSWMYGGDDIGAWPVTSMVPADVRPLAKYVDPYSVLWRCPADDHPTPWTYGKPVWSDFPTSYRYNAGIDEYPGLFEVRIDEVTWPSLTIMVGDFVWDSIRTNYGPSDFVTLKFSPSAWWHPGAFRSHKVVLGFLDGHASFTPIQLFVPNTETYRIDPY